MNRVLLKKIIIKNLGPIQEDQVDFDDFTFFIGRNNSGKSHYLKAVELLLSSNVKKDSIPNLQNDKSKPITIEGHFCGVDKFTSLVTTSNHKEAIEKSIMDGILRVVSLFDGESGKQIGIYDDKGEMHNPGGFSGNLLKVLPDIISIPATADTVQELADKSTTALGKLKKEVMSSFFQELAGKTSSLLEGLDQYLHSQDAGVRASTIIDFEKDLKKEFMGEFSDITPTVEFGLPDENVIAKEMKILLDDGNKTEVEQKGHGLQRATLLALLKLLAKSGKKYQNRPSPIFLIGELESFLHPFAQRQMAEALLKMKERYQIITTTHSPFIVLPETVSGYRKVKKTETGSKNIALKNTDIELDLIKHHLERRGNLEGLFADRIILIEGGHDENFYRSLMRLFNLSLPEKKFTLFIKADGRKQARVARKFYQQMNFDDISIICDLDYIFCNDIRNLLKEFKLVEAVIDTLRAHIEWTNKGDPGLSYILRKLAEKGVPKEMQPLIKELREKRIFVLEHGAPEQYYKNNQGEKSGWIHVCSTDDLLNSEYLKELMIEVLK